MKRKVCESLFAVTLALTVAVTNIPVTAFATEINQSARQEQTTRECTDRKSGTAVGWLAGKSWGAERNEF